MCLSIEIPSKQSSLAASIFIYLLYLPTPLSVYPDLFIYHCLSIFLSIKPSQALTRNNNFKQKQPAFSNVNIQINPKLTVERATGRYPLLNITIGNPRYSAFNFFLRTSGSAMPAFMKPMDLAVYRTDSPSQWCHPLHCKMEEIPRPTTWDVFETL